MSRLEDLKDLRRVLLDSIEAVEPDKRAPLANQLRLALREIAELEGAKPVELTVVSPIEKARLAREDRLKKA